MKILWIAAITLVFAGLPGRASAQNFFLSPFLDTTLTSPTGSGGASKAGFGVSFGKFPGVIGTETEIAYHPEILDNDLNALAKSHVFTGSQNLLFGPRIGKTRPYGAVGAGDLYLNVSSASLGVPKDIDGFAESLSNNYFTLNFGGGAMYFFTKRVAVRGDLRYFKAYGLDLPDAETENLSLKFKKFTFWRLGFGAAFAF
jgi:opacity protein-like surface antigen